MKWYVLDMLGKTLGEFDSEEKAHDFADKQKDYAYVVDEKEYEGV